MDGVVFAIHDESRDGGVMADLFCIEGITTDLPLVGLADKGIKGFFDVMEEHGDGLDEGVEGFDPVEGSVRTVIEDHRCSSEAFTIGFEDGLRFHSKSGKADSHK
jgi:hypothetical protein